MGSDQERDFYLGKIGFEGLGDPKDWEAVPRGTYRGIGEYQKYTGDDPIMEEGEFGPRVKYKKGDVISFSPHVETPEHLKKSKLVGPVESDEMLEEKKKYRSDYDLSDEEYAKARQANIDAKKYIKK